MRLRIAASIALCALIAVGTSPADAAKRRIHRYTKSYVTGSTPGLSFRFGTGDFNPGRVNPADEIGGPARGTPIDKELAPGTPADQYFLRGTPADQNFGGVGFLKGEFVGTPIKLEIKDTNVSSVQWAACQLNGEVPVCGSNGNDIQQIGCSTVGGKESLAGFRPRNTVGIWIIVADPAGIDGTACDGIATTGTVTLYTRT